MKAIPELLESTMAELMHKVNGKQDRYGNIKFEKDGRQYRYHPKKRVIRFEVLVVMDTHKEWVRLKTITPSK